MSTLLTYTLQSNGSYLGSDGNVYLKNSDETYTQVEPIPVNNPDPAPIRVPVGTLFTVANTTTVSFTDADLTAAGSTADLAARIHSSVIVIATTTTDPGVNIRTFETIPEGLNDNPQVIFKTVVKTTDQNAEIRLNTTINSSSISTTPTTNEYRQDDLYVTELTVTFNHVGDNINSFLETMTRATWSGKAPDPVYKHLILDQDLIHRHLTHQQDDPTMYCQELFSLFNISIVKMSTPMYNALRSTWTKAKVLEIDEKTVKYGISFFAEIRPVAKLWEASKSWYGEKIPTEITPEIVGDILYVMKMVAVQIIEGEFERRYLALRGASDFEAETWAIQREEAEDYLIDKSAPTPFIDYICKARNKNKDEFVTKVMANAKKFHEASAAMLVQMQDICAKFKACTTVWDINILYEDYLGISMPIAEAVALGRMTSESDWNRKPGYEVKGNGYYF
jgi:hypothetical protein